jgi:hypothetical protein
MLTSDSRAKIKTLAKRSIETGEDCDNIPDSMRRYLAMQAMEMGKGLGPNYMGRAGPYSAYGGGSMLLPENNNGKVGQSLRTEASYHLNSNHPRSHSTFHMPFVEHWHMASYWSSCYGLGHLLFS